MQIFPAYTYPYTVGDIPVQLNRSKPPPMNADLAQFLSGGVIAAVSWVPQVLFTYGTVPIAGAGNWKKLSGYVLSTGLFSALGAYTIAAFHILSKGAFDVHKPVGTAADYTLPDFKEIALFFAGGATSAVITLLIDVILADSKTGIRPALTPLVILGDELKETYIKSKAKKLKEKSKRKNDKRPKNKKSKRKK